MTDLELKEKLAQIDLTLAQNSRLQQEIRVEPWKVATAVITAAAALLATGLAAGVGLAKLWGGR